MKKTAFKTAVLAGLCFLISNTPVLATVPTEDRPLAVLRALDKITARVEELQVQVERPLKFGALVITVKACRTTPPEETPESAAFLDVSEINNDLQEKERKIFRGWMFASSPALSAMEHPVYDLWVTGCKTSSSN